MKESLLLRKNWRKQSRADQRLKLPCFLEKVLKLNNFTFNGEHYIQIKETAMWTSMAPSFANVYMGRLG